MRRYQRQSGKQKKVVKGRTPSVEITGKSFRISEPLRQLIIEKSRQLFGINTIHVVLSSRKDRQGTEAYITATANQESFQAKTWHSNAYNAVLSSFKKLRHQVDKHQKTRQDKKRHDASLSENEAKVLAEEEQWHVYDDLLPILPVRDASFTLPTPSTPRQNWRHSPSKKHHQRKTI